MSDRPEPETLPEPEAPESDTATQTQPFALSRPSDELPVKIHDVSFGFALGGYNRGRVDAYVQDVKAIVAELQISGSPQTAVKLALDRVGEQTAGILQEARAAAEELTATTLAEAEHLARRARVEAEELTESSRAQSRAMLERAAAESEEMLADARARLNDLQAEIEQAQSARDLVIEELRSTAAELDAFATDAAQEKPAALPSGSDEGEHTTESIPAVADRAKDRHEAKPKREPRPPRPVGAARR